MTDGATRGASGGGAGDLGSPALLSLVALLGRIMPLSVLCIVVAPPAVQAQEDCDRSPAHLGVRYEQQIHELRTSTVVSRAMELWRDGDRVMHVYPDRGLAEQWERSAEKGPLHLTVWFDADRQGIEYMPEDLGGRSDPQRWAEKWQLVSAKASKTLQSKTTSGTGCELIHELVKEASGRQVVLEWNASLQLPTRYTVTTDDRVEVWVAKEIIADPKRVRQAFDRRAAYATTDYIDIGDNESDPFLRKMIHLGFASHAASGFYDADGHALEGQDHPH